MKTQILVVDDEPSVREVFERILGKAGYDVEAVGDGETALSKFREQEPKLVLLDIRMPGKDGYETLQDIKRVSPEATVVMVTGCVEQESADRCFELGAADFIPKPFDWKTFLERIAFHTMLVCGGQQPAASPN